MISIEELEHELGAMRLCAEKSSGQNRDTWIWAVANTTGQIAICERLDKANELSERAMDIICAPSPKYPAPPSGQCTLNDHDDDTPRQVYLDWNDVRRCASCHREFVTETSAEPGKDPFAWPRAEGQ